MVKDSGRFRVLLRGGAPRISVTNKPTINLVFIKCSNVVCYTVAVLRNQLVNVIQPTIQSVTADELTVQRAQPDLDHRLTGLLTKLVQAQARLVAYEQPVSLAGRMG